MQPLERSRLSSHTAVIAAVGLLAMLVLASSPTLTLAVGVAFGVFAVASTLALAILPASLAPVVRYVASYALAASYATLAVRLVVALA